MKKNTTQLYIMIIYCITLLIWISINLFTESPVYAKQIVNTPQTEITYTETITEETTDILYERTTEQTTQEAFFDICVPDFLENYVIGAVAAEMPVYFDAEALKAQAVASRTYAMREYINDNNVDLYGIGQAYYSETELKQRWGADHNKNFAKIKKAVDDTRGELLIYQNEPILAAFCSASGGMTEDSGNVWGKSLAYLCPVKSEYDKKAPVYMQNLNFGISRLSAALGVDDASDIYVEKRSSSGYVLAVKAGGKNFSGDEVRRALGLRSNDFYVEIRDNTAYFTVYGFGHGIGMSQYGAEYMAEDGYGYKEILTHYYTGVSLVKTGDQRK